ncbi:hypothetical protein FPV67DRAFT_1683438 [Lyophyllum atratum]|nr:hypothetical protein FPV67DRAFT_1683438 [Lyophyllum atratum]
MDSDSDPIVSSDDILGYAVCPVCSLLFAENVAMKEHLQTHNDDPTIAYQMHGHVYLLHRDPSTRRFPCPFPTCHNVYQPESLYSHIATDHSQHEPYMPPTPEDSELHPCLLGRAYLPSSLSEASPYGSAQKGKRKAVDSPVHPYRIPRTPFTPTSLPKPSSRTPPIPFTPVSSAKPFVASRQPSRRNIPAPVTLRIPSSPPFFYQPDCSSDTLVGSSSPSGSSLSASAQMTTIPRSSFNVHWDGTAILNYLKPWWRWSIDGCVAHTVLELPNDSHHTSLHQCPLPLRTSTSHYYTCYRPLLFTTASALACWSCWCPQPFPDFGHDHSTGKSCRNEQHQDFWRAVPYLVWRCTALRTAVFGRLGLSADCLSTTEEFARWLVQVTVLPDRRITNLVAVVYAYFHLKNERRLPSPPFIFDGKSFVIYYGSPL